MPAQDRGTLSSNIRPRTLSLIWRAQRSDFASTPEVAVARARQRLEGGGAIVTAIDATTLSFQGRGRWGIGVAWWNSLAACRVRATRAGEGIAVTAEGSFSVLFIVGAILVIPEIIAGGWTWACILTVLFVLMGVNASRRLKDVAQYALRMIPDDSAV